MNIRLRAAALLLTIAAAVPAHAQEAESVPPPPPSLDQARAADRAAQGAVGRTAVNQAAGRGNAQVNLAVIALSAQGPGLADARSRQSAGAGERQRDAVARIEGQAFSASNGLLSLNQAAGSGNTQANVFVLGNGGALPLAVFDGGKAALDDDALASVAGTQPLDGPAAAPRLRQALIADDALRGGQGVVQVNQTAGVGNATTNAIVLRLPGGTP
ncbi:hypothetical protein [Lysobacter silvisoli]|uniref:Adhesin n=1 Tax=Lysobacter silvisoli TaxID=2293254 RepID=A0A371JY84_9GAMM|nr:hypothetical protein [Lysobacter silvisoli]RDZ26582.1 hypothetical protein DX914_16485 [Lysobacter silvisoli]